MTIRTEHLLLRPFETGDGPDYHAYMSDPLVTRFASFTPVTWEWAQEIIDDGIRQAQTSPDRPPYGFAIALPDANRLIGNCRLARIKGKPGEADIAYFLNSNYWGRGYATEAAHALLQYGFKELGLERIIALCEPENIASRRVMEKLGMQAQEPVTHYAADGNFHQGEFRDVTYLCYAIKKLEGKCK